MAGGTKRKLSIPTDRAAYQASEELFDVLRSSCSALNACSRSLGSARDKVQGIHATVDKVQAAMAIGEIFDSYEDAVGAFAGVFRAMSHVYEPFVEGAGDAAKYDAAKRALAVAFHSKQDVVEARKILTSTVSKSVSICQAHIVL